MYDLHNLGWHSFQQLCLTITREILGQTVESFLDSADAGKDGAFVGTWKPSTGVALSGRFVIQCKFTSKRDKKLRTSDLTDDVEKARKLVKAGRCDCYLLMTNAGVSGATAEKVETLFKQAGVKQVRSFGSTWISQHIAETKRLRMLVPRVYGLGDLSQILDERAYTQARALLASLREDLSKIVLTHSYGKAAEALDRHGFVLLIGEPAAGKTTIASMLSMAALDQWGASTLKLDSPNNVVERWNPDEPSQFFWIDDAFGVTQYESFLVHGWNHAIPQIRAMLRNGAKIVMTSRDYIYNRARNDLKEGAFPLLRESQVVIDVRDLTTDEKQQILYNHIKLGKQRKSFRTAIKPHLAAIANHPRFVPETARRLADPLFTAGLILEHDELIDFVDKQELFLQEVLQGLDTHSKAALAVIYMRDGFLESPVDLEYSERDALDRLGGNLGSCISALDALNGSLVQHAHTDGRSGWRFKHPTVGDAYAGLLLRNAELLTIYVRGSPIDKLLGQVTCGDIGLERAVILPKALFPIVLERLAGAIPKSQSDSDIFADWRIERQVRHFLAFRCSKDFLTVYLKWHPQVLQHVSDPGLWLSAVSEVDLAIRLHQLALLPEKNRKDFVKTVTDYAISGEDFYALENESVQGLFSSGELSAFRARIRAELLPRLREVRWKWEHNHRSDDDPSDHLQPLLDAMSRLKDDFSEESDVVKDIDQEIEQAHQWIAEASEQPTKERPARRFGNVDSFDNSIISERSIFDDIDE
jgi:hypothetical protein